jgi:hypothetical protein
MPVGAYAFPPGDPMVICPIAIAVGCRKCPIFGICPVKSLIGDYKPEGKATNPPRQSRTKASAAKKR